LFGQNIITTKIEHEIKIGDEIILKLYSNIAT
jgi:hypothetical protein